MKESITQELDYGCGVACFAFVCGMNFQQAINYLGMEYSVKHGWRPSDLVSNLNRFGYNYKNRYVRKMNFREYPNGTIVLLEKSEVYPVGHYLVATENGWMDPWINLPKSNSIGMAESGFRSKLPGKAMYTLIPGSNHTLSS